MQRKHDWPEALERVFLEHANTSFGLGSHDCLLAVCNAIHAMTDVDPGAEFRGTYSTELGFLRIVRERGHESLEQMVESLTAQHEMCEVGVKFAQRGDVVVFDTPEGPAFGIVHHNGVDSVCVGPEGLRRLPTLQARRAWRVG